MTHDPLCPYIEDTDGVVYAWNECECDLIAKVREDMLTKCIEALQPFYIKGEVSPNALRAVALQEKP